MGKFVFELQVGQKTEVVNGHGKRDYLVTAIEAWGEVQLRIVQLPTTKIGRLRFPETITLKLK